MLVVDNCPAHKITIDLKMIKLIFLPPNLTAKLQPLDQGIIKTFKTIFNENKLSHIIEKIESGLDTFLCYKKINLKDAILFLNNAWNSVSELTIKRCFEHAGWGFENNIIYEVGENKIQSYDEFISKAKINDPIDENDFIELGYDFNDVIIDESHNDDIDLMESERSTVSSENNNIHSKDQVEELEIQKVSKQDLYLAFDTLKEYFKNSENYDIDAINGIDLISKALKKKRFGTLNDWFIKNN